MSFWVVESALLRKWKKKKSTPPNGNERHILRLRCSKYTVSNTWCSVFAHLPCSVIFRDPGYCATRRRFSEIWKRHKTTATFIFSLFFAFSVISSLYTFFCSFSPFFFLYPSFSFLYPCSYSLLPFSPLSPLLVLSSPPLHFHHNSLLFPSSAVLFLFYLFSSFFKSIQQCLQVNQFLSASRRQIRVLQAGRGELNTALLLSASYMQFLSWFSSSIISASPELLRVL